MANNQIQLSGRLNSILSVEASLTVSNEVNKLLREEPLALWGFVSGVVASVGPFDSRPLELLGTTLKNLEAILDAYGKVSVDKKVTLLAVQTKLFGSFNRTRSEIESLGQALEERRLPSLYAHVLRLKKIKYEELLLNANSILAKSTEGFLGSRLPALSVEESKKLALSDKLRLALFTIESARMPVGTRVMTRERAKNENFHVGKVIRHDPGALSTIVEFSGGNYTWLPYQLAAQVSTLDGFHPGDRILATNNDGHFPGRLEEIFDGGQVVIKLDCETTSNNSWRTHHLSRAVKEWQEFDVGANVISRKPFSDGRTYAGTVLDIFESGYFNVEILWEQIDSKALFKVAKPWKTADLRAADLSALSRFFGQ